MNSVIIIKNLRGEIIFEGNKKDLRWANLRWANLSKANLSEANLSEADLRWANLSKANLSEANLSKADLRWANLSEANLSEAIGLLDPIEYIDKSFKKTLEGYIIEKSFNEVYPSNSTWNIVPGEIIAEVVNFDRTNLCGCGINGGTEEWCNRNCEKERWLLLLRFEWLAGVCVPYNTNGQIRMSRAEILGRKGEVNFDK
jgi:hypothetical protein